MAADTDTTASNSGGVPWPENMDGAITSRCRRPSQLLQRFFNNALSSSFQVFEIRLVALHCKTSGRLAPWDGTQSLGHAWSTSIMVDCWCGSGITENKGSKQVCLRAYGSNELCPLDSKNAEMASPFPGKHPCPATGKEQQHGHGCTTLGRPGVSEVKVAASKGGIRYRRQHLAALALATNKSRQEAFRCGGRVLEQLCAVIVEHVAFGEPAAVLPEAQGVAA